MKSSVFLFKKILFLSASSFLLSPLSYASSVGAGPSAASTSKKEGSSADQLTLSTSSKDPKKDSKKEVAKEAAEITGDSSAPSLQISGATSFFASTINQKQRINGVGGNNAHLGIGESDLVFKVKGQGSKGFDYSAVVDIESIPNNSTYVKKAYIELAGRFGTFQFGNVSGPELTMMENAISIVGIGYGVTGPLNGAYNFSSGAIKTDAIMGQTKTASKIAYYTPRFEGLGGYLPLQLAVAFTPSTQHLGDQDYRNNQLGGVEKGNLFGVYPNFSGIKNKIKPWGTRNIAFGANLQKAFFEKWSYSLAASTVREQTRAVNPFTNQVVHLRNGTSWQVSGALGYDAFRMAAGYINNGKSRLPKDNSFAVDPTQIALLQQSSLTTIPQNVLWLGDTHLGDAGKIWNIGASYTWEAYKFYAAYNQGNRKNTATDKTQTHVVTLGINYRAFQGLRFFTEVDFLKTKTNAAAMAVDQAALNTDSNNINKAVGNNRGTFFMVGTALSF